MADNNFKIGDEVRYLPIKSGKRTFTIRGMRDGPMQVLIVKEVGAGNNYEFYAKDCEPIVKVPKSLMTW